MKKSSQPRRRPGGVDPRSKSRQLSRAGSEVHGASGLGSSASPRRTKGDQR